jgi:hypothetical protein
MLVCILAMLAAGCTSNRTRDSDETSGAPAARSMRTFRNMAEFDEYRARVRAAAKKRGIRWSQALPAGAE